MRPEIYNFEMEKRHGGWLESQTWPLYNVEY